MVDRGSAVTGPGERYWGLAVSLVTWKLIHVEPALADVSDSGTYVRRRDKIATSTCGRVAEWH
jgi:hypothetical protein